MLLAFKTRGLRAICENRDLAIEQFGVGTTNSLTACLADLRAAQNLAEIPGDLIGLDCAPPATYFFQIGGHRLLFMKNHQQKTKTSEDKINFNSISRLIIIGIEANEAE